MKEIVLKINGMKCTGCSQRLERVLKNVEGVEDASVDLDTREAKINCKDDVAFEVLNEAVEDAGFEVE